MFKLVATVSVAFFLCAAGAFGQAFVGPASVAVRPNTPTNIYRLSPNDIVRIKVFGEDELDTTARIGKDYTIPFPLIGTAAIGGQTVPEATKTLEGLLREYLRKPQVSLTISEYSKRRFTVLGEVAKPGIYDMPDETTVNLLEAIGMAGGYTHIANPSRISVKRIVQGEETLIKLDARKMLKDGSTPRFEVLPGDTILIGESLF